jgi:hypothetical protein
VVEITYREGNEVTSGGLYRRIFPHPDWFKDGRPTSYNFLPDRGEDDLSLFRAAEKSTSEMLENHDGFGLLEIEAAVLWGLGKRVIYSPSRGGKGHVSVFGFSKKDAQSRRDAAFASRLLIAPTIKPKSE